jgi:hypothetical protein
MMISGVLTFSEKVPTRVPTKVRKSRIIHYTRRTQIYNFSIFLVLNTGEGLLEK